MKSILSFLSHHGRKSAIFFILLLGVVVRTLGLTWGIDTTGGSDQPFHPDEEYALRAVRQMNFDEMDLNPEKSHVEGTFYYYITSAAYVFYQGVDQVFALVGLHVPTYPWNQATTLVWIARVVSVISGALMVFLLYRICVILKIPLVGALLASTMVAVFPIDVIYSQFMRPHVFANTLFAGGLLFMLLPSQNQIFNKWRYALVGFLLGLSTAARYNMALTILIPGMFILLELFKQKFDLRKLMLNRDLWQLGLGFLAGFFVGDPYLFLDYGNMKVYLEKQQTFMEPDAFAWRNLANLQYPLAYLTYLIPQGGGLIIALVAYGAAVVSFFNKQHRALVIALSVYLLVYLYAMGKGYSHPIFARAILPLLPVFALYLAISYDFLQTKLKHQYYKTIFVVMFLIGTIQNGVLIHSYFTTMNSTVDARYQLVEYAFTDEMKGKMFVVEDHVICGNSINSVFPGNPLNWRFVKPPLLETALVQLKTTEAMILCDFDQGSERDILALLQKFPSHKVKVVSRNQDPLLYQKITHDMLYPFTRFYVVTKE